MVYTPLLRQEASCSHSTTLSLTILSWSDWTSAPSFVERQFQPYRLGASSIDEICSLSLFVGIRYLAGSSEGALLRQPDPASL